MKENKIWNDYLPEDMQEHWTVYECLKESEDSSTFLVKETATGILCVLKWGRNRQTEFLRNEMEIMKKMADRKLSGACINASSFFAFLSPSSACFLNFVSDREITAISDAAKKALIAVSMTRMRMDNNGSSDKGITS